MKFKLFLIFLLIFNIVNSLTIEHVPMENATTGNSIYIYIKVLPAEDIREVKLHYKRTLDMIYLPSLMENIGGDIYLDVIPSTIVTTAGLEYFIAATANNGTLYYAPCEGDCTRRSGYYRVRVGVSYCEDETPFSQCSETKPKRCINGVLQDDCEICGCSVGICQADGTCVIETPPPENETEPENESEDGISSPSTPELENIGLYLFGGIVVFIIILFLAVFLRR